MVAIQGGMLEEANGAHGHLCRRLTCLLLALSNSCECPLSRSLLGVKRTWAVALHMSANDPKRTCDEPISRLPRKIVDSQYQGLVGLGLLFEELT